MSNSEEGNNNLIENEAEEEHEETEKYEKRNEREDKGREEEEEEEEEEEGPDDYVRDGFVVDEIEEGGEETGEEQEKKKKRKRKRMDETLDPDDLILLKDAGIVPVGQETTSKRFKRLQKKANAKEVLREKLFEGSEVDEDEEQESHFIEEHTDEDSFGEEDEFVEDSNKRSYRKNRYNDSKIFDEEMDQEEFVEKKVAKIEESFEPQELIENFFAKEDKDIQALDVPERLQLRDKKIPKYEKRYHYCPSNRASIFKVSIEQLDGTKVEKEISIFSISELKEILEVDSENHILLYIDSIKTFAPLIKEEDLYQIKEGSQLKIVKEDDYDNFFKSSIEKRNDLELKNEAEWIYRSVFEGNIDNLNFSSIVAKIVYVLKFLKRDRFEVPFIYTYRKDYYLPDLKLSDLWEIYDWDEKWEHLQYRKSFLYEKYLSAKVPDEYFILLEESSKETEVQDLYDHFLLHYGTTVEQIQKKKRAQKRDLYSICRKNGIIQLTKKFGLTASQLGHNMAQSSMIHFPDTSETSPEDLANEYIKTEFKTPEAVLSAARSAMAQEIAYDPKVRASIRPLYEKNIAGIFTSPTPKGIKEIDAFHPYRIVLNIVNKPPQAFNRTQFLTILKAQKEGYINFKIDYSREGYEDNLREMENLYFSYCDENDEVGKSWNEQRKLILSEALTKYLYPLFEKELIHSLTEQAKERVTLAASEQFTKLLMQGRFQPLNSDYHNNSPNEITVMACVCGIGREPTFCVVLDPDGIPKAQIKLNNVDKEKEILLKFIRDNSPHVVAIGASWEANRLYSIINKEKNSDNIHVAYVNTEIARIFQDSPRAKSEFSELPSAVRQAICLGRYLQDPLTELAGLCGAKEDIYMNLHPYQAMVGSEQLHYALQKCVINVTNSVGVDINRVLRHKHASSLLQFVSGFGPRKSTDLIQKIQRRGGNVSSREELEQWLGSCVFTNCAGFIRILKKYAIQEWTPLDDTRIHPEDYLLVEKMAKDALETNKKKIIRLMQEPKKLDDVDLDEFAEELKRKGRPKKKSTLYDIKKEVNHPFQDPREDYRDPFPEELFFYFTGEDKDNFIEGQLVSARVLLVGDKELRCRLELGIPAVIHIANASDESFESFSEIGVNQGDTLACRLKHLKISQDGLEAELTCRSSDLQSDIYEQQHLEFLKKQEGYLQDLDPRFFNQDKQKVIRRPLTRKIIPRQIDHPLFVNETFQAAEQRLSNQERGEVVIRPSSKGLTFLNITWKFYDDIYVHITVREEDKPNPRSLGKTLYIEDEKFEDLDEIISRYIEPLNQLVKDMLNFRRFHSGTLEEVKELLTKEKQADKTRIPYYIIIDHQNSGKFLIVYLPRQNPKRESINLTPKGFRFRGKIHSTPEKLVDWFKRHWKEVPKPRSPPSSSSLNELTSTNSQTSSSRNQPSNSSSWGTQTSNSWENQNSNSSSWENQTSNSSSWGTQSSQPSAPVPRSNLSSNQPTQGESSRWTSEWGGSYSGDQVSFNNRHQAPTNPNNWGNPSNYWGSTNPPLSIPTIPHPQPNSNSWGNQTSDPQGGWNNNSNTWEIPNPNRFK